MNLHHSISLPVRWLLALGLLGVLTLFGLGLEVTQAQGPCTPAPNKPCDIPKRFVLVEGDIQVPIKWQRKGPNSTFDRSVSLWTGGNVPFEFDRSNSAANVANFPISVTIATRALDDWARVANIHPTRCANDACPRGPHIHFQNSSGNNSPYGMQANLNTINVVSWHHEFIIAHEIGHSLGYLHEQCRADRGFFIQINTANIQAGQADQFCAVSSSPALSSFYGPYDFDSVMHYDDCAFSVDCPIGSSCSCTHKTITVFAPNQAWQSKIGQRDHLSWMDRLTMSFLYPRTNWSFMDRDYTGATQAGTFLQPYKQYPNAYNQTPSGGTLWLLRAGTYTGISTLSKPMTINAPLGATLGR